jgi:tRNA(Ile)-lysidine synthase
VQLDAAFARALAVLDPPRPLALAVSGGPDSVALMHLAAPLQPVVFTVDHGLRAGSATEAAGVAAAAARLGLVHETLHWTGDKPTAGLQAAARAARYRLLAAACAGVGAATLLTGHTLDDQMETIAMRRAKGSGAAGLAGMASQTRLPGSGVRLARPLLGVRKADLVAFLVRMGAAYVTDPSNVDVRFDRGRLRSDGTADVAAAEIAEAGRQRVHQERAALASMDGATNLPDGAILLERAALAALPAGVDDVALTALLRRVGGNAYPGTQAERGRVLAAIRAEGPFAGRTLAGCGIRRATRAEATAGDWLVITAERTDRVLQADWWLPFAQYPQIGPDGLSLTETGSLPP